MSTLAEDKAEGSIQLEAENPFKDLDLEKSKVLSKVQAIREERPPLNLDANATMISFREWNHHYLETVPWLETDFLKDWLAIPILRKQKEQAIDNAFSVLKWYQDFIGAKLLRALGGKHEHVEGLERSQSDWNGSAKVALLALEDIIAATEKLLQITDGREPQLIRFWQLSQNFKEELGHEFPYAFEFIRPGFDTLGLKSNLGLD